MNDRSEMSSQTLNWSIYRPLVQDNISILNYPTWQQELAEFRGRIYYQNGKRPQYLDGAGKVFDWETCDDYSYHLVLRWKEKVIGCGRILAPISSYSNPLTFQTCDSHWVLSALSKIGIDENSIAECGRLTLDEKFRGEGLGMKVIAGLYALSHILGMKTAIAIVGTILGQDLIIKRSGAKPFPGLEPIFSPIFQELTILFYKDLTVHPRNFQGTFQEMKNMLKEMLT